MTTIGNLENTIWYQLDIWAKDFKPWQRLVLANIIRSGCLTDDQITEAYNQFLFDNESAGQFRPNTYYTNKNHWSTNLNTAKACPACKN